MADYSSSPFSVRDGIERNMWHIAAKDTDIDTAFDVVSEDAAWAQITADDEIEIKSSSTADQGMNVKVLGVDSAGDRKLIIVVTDSSNGTTVVPSTQKFTSIENAWLEELAAGTITIQKEADNVAIQAITTGQLWAPTVHHYAGDRASYITAWGCRNLESAQVMEFKLEIQNAAGTVVDEIDYENLGNLGVGGADFVKDRGGAIRVAPGYKVVVSGKCDANNKNGFGFLTGYDRVS